MPAADLGGGLRIILQDDITTISRSREYHQGDLLNGQILIPVYDHTEIDRIVVSFEGITRTWVDDDGQSTALQHVFLKQSQSVPPQERILQHTNKRKQCTAPFKFRIASRCFPIDGLSAALSQLPPSLQEGESCADRQGRPCMQPLIVYGVRVSVVVRDRSNGTCQPYQNFRHVKFVPHTEAGPPLSMDHFPGEFCSAASSSLRTHRLSRSAFGKLSISLMEPRPLAVPPEGAKCRIDGQLHLRFCYSEAETSKKEAPRFFFELHTRVIKKMFYSTMPLKEVASNNLMKSNKYLRCKKEELVASIRNIDRICFTRNPAACGEWVGCILTPLDIGPQVQLLPTFCSPLSTLRYSLSIKLRVHGVAHSQLQLEVPLQVYCRHTSATEAHHSSPSSDDEELGLAAMAENTELPPLYYQ